ncbi:DSD1 family PLP-dependent enzyme [Croceicoccus sp. BE223]|uniref:DSD1 family PLP-dependent enzyme n=1 Tax=Croceicoccus sp. BE223 TaxID=2817716 RepID=UPI00285E2CB5|nr:DSD1 family PLP-dependent enzyme [Croceicoccus sp. BE223]MDR7101613.1 D-serine deaminase-like pyridoxal phosphate-dependent protein [Croceicoccus sp. BE223]
MLELMDETAVTASGRTLADLPTPALVLDRDRMDRNLARLAQRMERFGVTLRPHLKTAKSVDAARRIHPDGPGPITVSTLAEAEYFAREGGYTDITYAVGLDPTKAPRAVALCLAGVDLKVVLDTPEQAAALGEAARKGGAAPSVLIEIDCDGHRGGLEPDHPGLVPLARAIEDAGLTLAGVLTHAGASYDLRDPEALADAAENERLAVVQAAETLRAAGFACPMVSVGSTPTSHFARDLTGVTEVRAGVYMFFDLVMHGVGVCTTDDIAVSVLSTVIGHKPDKGWILVDAGWMAMSRDRGTASQPVDQGYGLVCDIDGVPFEDLIVDQANQEHGILALRKGSTANRPDLPVGTRVRILPNHACATGAQHEAYNVVAGGDEVVAVWPRMRGW